MIIKFDGKLSAVSPFDAIFLMKPLSLLVLIYSYMSANFNDIRFYCPWSSTILLRTL